MSGQEFSVLGSWRPITENLHYNLEKGSTFDLLFIFFCSKLGITTEEKLIPPHQEKDVPTPLLKLSKTSPHYKTNVTRNHAIIWKTFYYL